MIIYVICCFSQEFRLDSRELTCKLSGLEIGSGRSNDSGVASPSEEGENTESKSRSSGGSKSRTQSGEDPGLGGSEQGELSLLDVSSCHHDHRQGSLGFLKDYSHCTYKIWVISFYLSKQYIQGLSRLLDEGMRLLSGVF